MKNQLLLGSALLASVIAVAQNSGTRATVRPIDPNKYLMNKVSTPTEPPIQALAPIANPTQPSVVAKTTASTSIVWNAISGSMNIFGVLTTDQKPLQYNDELNTVSFIHRKSPTYISNPVASPSTAASGVIVGMFTKDWGNTWDSTAVWNNNVQHARYPQGGLYNPPGNTSLSNAYVVVTGPVTSAGGTGWVGNYAASKKLDVFNNVASTATMAQQFFDASAPTASVLGRLSFLRNDFHSPEDGRVWAMASIFDDPAGTTIATQGWRGTRILKGTFNSTNNAFDWTSDSIKPPVVITTTAGSSAGVKNAPMLLSNRMAWSESGQVGYVYFMGSLQGRTGRNVGIQPIVYRTIDHGATWHPIDGINFDDTYFKKPVLDHIPGTILDTTYKIPFFLESSDTPGIDAVVDADNNLHIAATVAGTTKRSTDSLLASSFTFSLSSDNEEGYSFGHTPGLRPYVYDFICKPSSATSTASGATWSVVVVDSMSTEAPGTAATDAGVNDNPWNVNPDGNTKAPVSPRLQLSRTSNGKYIVFTWSESDTIFTNGVRKWNSMPDIKARVMDVTRGYTVNPIEINLTTPDGGFADPGVSTKAFMQYVSPECKYVTEYTTFPSLTNGVEIILPVTISNSSPLSQLTGNTHWYTSAALSFTYATLDVGIAENNYASVKNSVIYPNPAKNNATLNINMKESSKVSVSVMNTVGQVVKTNTVSTVAGDNKIDVDVRGLAAGIYLVNVTSGNSTSTKKLIVE